MSRNAAIRRPIAPLALAAALAVAMALPGVAQSPSAAAPTGTLELGAITLTVEPFAEGLDSPVFVTGDGSGTGWLYAVEQGGRIVAISPEGQVAETPVLDITDRVTAGGEQGLLGLALHPAFRENGRLFVNYTRAEDGATVVAEFQVGENGLADPATERQLLVIDQPYPNHNGGMIGFDAIGMLVIGMGDGGAGGDPQGYGQAPGELLGKMLRIDVDGAEPYAIPADNPFADGAAAAPEIWTLGMRNPWRWSVDRQTGDLWIGDVGQGDWEEVSVLPAGTGGANLGWNTMEGDVCYGASDCDTEGLTMPVAVISHNDGACSVIGGYVYRGSAIPALSGGYVYTDLCIGTLWVLDAAAAVATGTAEPVAVGQGGGQMVSFGEGDDGELFVVDQGGSILRLVADPSAAR
jgi:glucose/arabinose dehydrogenase